MSEYADVYSCEHRKARKKHTCCECRGEISGGEKYFLHTGLWEGSWFHYKMCSDCNALEDEINGRISMPDERVSFGDLEEHVFEEGDVSTMRKFLENKVKRKATISTWMTAHFDNVINRDDELAELAMEAEYE